MKKIRLKFIYLSLFALLPACSDETDQAAVADQPTIKMVRPEQLVTGQRVYITGNNFSEVSEIIFPGNISITDFERVGFNQLSVVTPAGIEDGILILKTNDGTLYESPNEIKAVSPLFKSLFPTQIKTGEELTILGENLLEIKQVIFPDNVVVNSLFFNRKSNTEIKVKVPAGTIDDSGMLKMVFISGMEVNATNIDIEVVESPSENPSKVDPITENSIILLDYEPHGEHKGDWDNSWGGNTEIVTDPETGNTFLRVTGNIDNNWILNCNHQANIGDGATWPWSVSDAENYIAKVDVLIPSDVDGTAATGFQFVFGGQWKWYGDNLLPKTTDGEWVTIRVPLSALGMEGPFDFSKDTNGLFGTVPMGVCFDNLRVDPTQ